MNPLRTLVAAALLGFAGAPSLAAAATTTAAAEDGAPAAYAAPRSAVFEVKDGERSYRLYVAAPPGYDRKENALRRYPVIYLNDGDLFFMTAAGAPVLPWSSRAFGEAIIVGVSYAVGERPLASRKRDLTPVASSALKGATGGAAAYLEVFRSRIIPLVEARYRADPERRIIAGHSLGGTFALYAMLEDPTLFSGVIAISPALWYGERDIAAREALFSRDNSKLPVRLYMAVGDLEGPKGGYKSIDMVGDQTAFAARLRSRGYVGLEIADEVLAGGVTHATSFQAAWLKALAFVLARDERAP